MTVSAIARPGRSRSTRRRAAVPSVGDQVAPRGRGGRHAEAEEGECRLEQDRVADPQRALDDQRQHRGGGSRCSRPRRSRRRAGRPRGLHELALAQRQDLAADQARRRHPGRAADDEHRRGHRGAVERHEQQREEQPRDGQGIRSVKRISRVSTRPPARPATASRRACRSEAPWLPRAQLQSLRSSLKQQPGRIRSIHHSAAAAAVSVSKRRRNDGGR